MKVSSVELKTRLGHYLRSVERTGVPLEVCVRNQPVAILAPHGGAGYAVEPNSEDKGLPLLALERSGLKLEPAAVRGQPPTLSPPLVAGDGRDDVMTVESMRAGRDW